ncbi:LLM class flavin-dependent oxidoreductase [Streptacidiphilus sp. N1-3]|uniref:LLM class flavin-dependent oxidoreductase n=1 Tax=Streptacidiphilus alkalitolerans TaxID=3342712 RepID=A0ABV6WWZ4_9ACTN
MTTYSVLIPFVPRRPEQVLPYAALVQWTHAHRLWQGQSLLVDPYQGFAHAAGVGFRVPTGIGVSLMPLHHPYTAALQARSLSLTTGQPVLAGFGPGAPTFQRDLLGAPYASPLTAAREYLGTVRGLLTGRPVATEGSYYHCHAALPPSPGARVEVGLGVLRPGMARLAGELADTAITWLAPATYLRDTVVPALREGAERAGRKAAPTLTAVVPVALAVPDRDPAEFALAGSGAHLQGAHYRDMLRRAGIGTTGSDPAADAKALVAGGAFVSGELPSLVEQLAEFAAAGADEVVLNLTGVFAACGPQVAMEQLKKILAALL